MFSFLLLVAGALFSLVAALPVRRDVWVPQITYPTNNTVWVAGSTYSVTWDTASMPSQVTNPNGMVFLRRNSATQNSALAQGFPLSSGAVSVTVPADTQPDTEWAVVLFGDSGNWSPPFAIVPPSS